jgi:hypothetical protein
MGHKKKDKDSKRSKSLKRKLEDLPDWKKKQRSNVKKYATI